MNKFGKIMIIVFVVGLAVFFALTSTKDVSAKGYKYSVCIDIAEASVPNGYVIDSDGFGDLYLYAQTLQKGYRVGWGMFFGRNFVYPEGRWTRCYPVYAGFDTITLTLRDQDGSFKPNSNNYDVVDISSESNRQSLTFKLYPKFSTNKCRVEVQSLNDTSKWSNNECHIQINANGTSWQAFAGSEGKLVVSGIKFVRR